MYEIEPRYQMLMNQYPSEQAIMDQLNQANQAPSEGKAGPLLSAGLGAGIGMGATSLPLYYGEKDRIRQLAEKAMSSYANKNDMVQKGKNIKSKVQNLFNPVGVALDKESLKQSVPKMKEFAQKTLDPDFLKQKGIKKLMRSPGKLGLGALGGAGLGYLANQIYRKHNPEA